MEEKWDLYLRADRLFVVRSWTGDVLYAATLSWGRAEWQITHVQRADGVQEEPNRSIQVLDYLIKSHLYNLAAPHPLQPAFRGDEQALALASFSEFGRRALYGTFDDVLQNAAIQRALWG
jgi:hypothetical protein